MTATYLQEQIDLRTEINVLKGHKHDVRYFIVDDKLTISDANKIAMDYYGGALRNAIGLGNIGIGSNAGRNITVGYHNIVIGDQCAYLSTTGTDLIGYYNIIMGAAGAGRKITSGSYNNLSGYGTGRSITVGHGNYLVGQYTGEIVEAGNNNIGICEYSLHGQSNPTKLSGDNNIGVGAYSLGSIGDTANNNIGIGYRAGEYVDGTQTVRLLNFDDVICIGHDSYATASGEMSLGNSTFVTAAYTAAAFSTRSDERYKNFEEMDLGLEFINDLDTKKYTWKDGADTDTLHYGFSAQQVKKTLELNVGDAKRSMHKDRGGEQNLTYTEFIAPMVKAIQELTEMNKELLHRIEVLEG